MGEGHRPEFHLGETDGRVLGDDDYLAEVLGRSVKPKRCPDLAAVIAAVADAYGLAPTALASVSRARKLSEARGVAAVLATEAGGNSLTEVAKAFGRSLPAMSESRRAVEARRAQNQSFDDWIESINNRITEA